MNLGYQSNYPSALSGSIGGATEDGEAPEKATVYPGITIRGDAAEKLCTKCDIGDTITATVKLKVVGMSKRGETQQEYGGEPNVNVEFDVLDLEPQETKKGKKAAKEETAEDAVDGYLKEKAEDAEED